MAFTPGLSLGRQGQSPTTPTDNWPADEWAQPVCQSCAERPGYAAERFGGIDVLRQGNRGKLGKRHCQSGQQQLILALACGLLMVDTQCNILCGRFAQ